MYTARRFLYQTAIFLCASFHTLHGNAATPNHLANTTVLIVRHAEKPVEGSSLTPQGFKRAEAYAHYFAPFEMDGKLLEINALYAASDTKNSVRPRLTLEPLSQALHLPIDQHYASDAPEDLASALATTNHGNHVLIAWRHKKIAALIQALGGSPAQLLPEDKWPDQVYDWVVLLHFDAQGKLDHQALIHEPNLLPSR
ncbi:MAG: hypothetical protein PW735_12580 [Acidobacteriaceae bacterium]|nr:hypothetical protein [Acidobacteriaceae bacterium]